MEAYPRNCNSITENFLRITFPQCVGIDEVEGIDTSTEQHTEHAQEFRSTSVEFKYLVTMMIFKEQKKKAFDRCITSCNNVAIF